jgi:hypothetical protein
MPSNKRQYPWTVGEGQEQLPRHLRERGLDPDATMRIATNAEAIRRPREASLTEALLKIVATQPDITIRDAGTRALVSWKSLLGHVSSPWVMARSIEDALKRGYFTATIPDREPEHPMPAVAHETLIIAIRPGVTTDTQALKDLLESEGFRVYVQVRI